MLKDEIKTAVLTSLAQDLGIPLSKVMQEGIGCTDIKRFLHLDITAQLLPAEKQVSGCIITKEPCIFVGKQWIQDTFACVDDNIKLNWSAEDGQRLQSGDTIVTFSGAARSILIAERCALNFAQTLSGTATTVNRYAELLEGSNTQILDTRKTIPGMRFGQKYAVTCGGGANHRIGLYDRFLIKENHIMAAGSIAAAIATAKQMQPEILVEVEVESLDELQQAIDANADIVMLDNFQLADIHTAVELVAGRLKLEVSGNVEAEHLKELANTGVDFISSGALTKHVQATDLSLRLDN
ncbi:MAG: carboxylating nicotinate-nucleotide diphosphorylase [Aestuariibacter sp.]